MNQPPFVSLITRRTDDVHVHASMCCLRCAARKLHLARPGSTNLQQPGRRMEKNQLGSTLTITAVQPSGQLSGTYISPSGTTGSVYPLVGWFCQSGCWVDGIEQTARHHFFSVHWGNYGSMTAWTGTCDASGGVPTITTVWHLVRTASQYAWDHMLTNSDVFRPQMTESCRRQNSQHSAWEFCRRR
ncbi:autotransporter [Xanthomonas oryzae pv. oryzae]|nr:autotransporter [Xanthomonas oryzae pv. oryzae]